MAKNQDTLFRLWHLLQCLPRYPHKKSVQEIAVALRDEGFVVTERTIQRDLQQLSTPFQLYCDERSKPYGWCWSKEARRFDLPGMMLNEALAWGLLEQHLQLMLPSPAADHLAPYFATARQRLRQAPEARRSRSWMEKIRLLPPNQPLIPPHIDPQVHSVVSEALFCEKQLQIRYRKKHQAESELYQVHPLALIQRGHVLYLYARLFDYPDARSLALHRIESALCLDEAASYPAGFDLDECVNRGVWGFGGEQQCELVLRFYDRRGEHLYETPLASDQQILVDDEAAGILTARATVPDTPQLRWWILGFGGSVEVLAPASLRHELSQQVANMQARYTSPAAPASGLSTAPIPAPIPGS